MISTFPPLASADESSFLIPSTFRPCAPFPLTVAMPNKPLSTPLTVSGFGLNMVGCVDLDLTATSPRSPISFWSCLITARLRPVLSPIAFIINDSPMPSSTPA